jgi:hypothetical protein
MTWGISKGEEFYVRCTRDGAVWSAKRDEAYKFPYESVAGNALIYTPGMEGAEIFAFRS